MKTWIMVAVLGMVSCAALRPKIEAADEAARVLCAVYHALDKSIPTQEALTVFCDTRDAWAPWLKSGQELRVDVEVEGAGGDDSGQ